MDYTTRLGLNKPNPDPVTGDDVDITELNANFDKLDSVVSFTVATSTARPPAPFAGQAILETDTGSMYVWGGSDWLPLLGGTPKFTRIGIGTPADANAARRLKILQSGTNGAVSNVLIEQTGAAAGSRALSVKAGGEANERWWVDYDGKMQWGPGTAGADVNLYRSAADKLKTDDSLEVGGSVAALGDLSTLGNLTVSGTVNASGIVYTAAYSGTTDASGFLTVTHGLGFTPVGVWGITTNPASSFAQVWGVDTIGATTLRFRIANANGGALASTAVSGRLFAIK